MVIGMIATIVMFQVFSASEERTRATTGAGDTQSIGNITLATLKSQIARAGYGFVSPGNNMSMSILGCSIALRPSGAVLSQLAPVIINPTEITGKDPNTDSLLIAYGTARGAQEGTFLMKAEEVPVEGEAQAALFARQLVPVAERRRQRPRRERTIGGFFHKALVVHQLEHRTHGGHVGLQKAVVDVVL